VIPSRVALCVFVAWVLQVGLFAELPVAGARADVMIVLGIAAGFVGGPDRGAIVGFAAGLAIDLVLPTPLGLSAAVYTVVGYLAGRVSGTMPRSSWWLPAMTCSVGSAVGVVLYALVGVATLSGPPLTAIVAVTAVVNAVLGPAAVRAMRWSLSSDNPGHRLSTR
jgi:rod shape-determining protein MreD